MPAGLPQRQSLVAQTVAFLEAQIEQAQWRDWLPSERSLCAMLQISRNTLRGALEQLKKQGRIRAVHGAGNQIIAASRPRNLRRRGRDVALLTPDPVERLRPMQSLWIDEMRALLGERDMKLRVFHGEHYFGRNPAPRLDKLVAQNPHGCWILMLANETVQRWFSANRIPCIVAGSTHPGIELPFRDLDHRATCRHAAGVLLGLGHRRIVMLAHESTRAGDLESEAGFVEGVKQSRHDVEPLIVHHDVTVGSVAHAVGRILKLRPAPTAMLVVHPHYYLAVASRLAQAGANIPRDISLICRDDDPFLSFLAPLPARYAASPRLLARSLLRPVLELLDGRGVTQSGSYLMPEFQRGESIGPPSGPVRR